jgi:hypothetical protein
VIEDSTSSDVNNMIREGGGEKGKMKAYMVPIVITVNAATPSPSFSYSSAASFQLILGGGSSFGCPSD